MPCPRRTLFALCICLPTLAGPVALWARSDPMPLFATCTGRLSALMEFQWLMQDRGADQTEQQRETMAGLLDAVLTPDRRVQAMDLRLQAKVAVAALLQEAAFAQDRVHATWAQRRVSDLLTECTALLTS